MQNPSYTYDEYLISIGLGPSIVPGLPAYLVQELNVGTIITRPDPINNALLAVRYGAIFRGPHHKLEHFTE